MPLAVALWAPPALHAAGAHADLVDVIARIDYGYYARDTRLIEAARTDLARVRAPEAARGYYDGYAAYRLLQLGERAAARTRRALSDQCLQGGELASEDPEWAVEGLILIAACASAALETHTGASLNNDLRLAHALEGAGDLEREHPRLLLVGALAVSDDGKGKLASDDVQTALELAVARFEAFRGSSIAPSWGKAEALAGLAQLHLEHGRLRDARDLIERSLIEAPDYHFALELRKELSLRR